MSERREKCCLVIIILPENSSLFINLIAFYSDLSYCLNTHEKNRCHLAELFFFFLPSFLQHSITEEKDWNIPVCLLSNIKLLTFL